MTERWGSKASIYARVRAVSRMGRVRFTACVAVCLASVSGVLPMPSPASAQTSGGGVSQVGFSNLGGGGLNGGVAVVGNTAVVGFGVLSSGGVHTGFYNPMPCPTGSVKIVDIANPASPAVVATIPLAAGVAAPDVDALSVSTTFFTGDLLAVALNTCSAPGSGTHRGVAYYNITNPANPLFLGRYFADSELFSAGVCSGSNTNACSSSQHEVELVQRGDGTVLSLSTEPGATASAFPSKDLRIVDVTNPSNPVQIASYPPSLPIFSNNGCRPFSAGHGPATINDGTTGLLASVDAGMFSVNLNNPATPSTLGQFNPYGTTRTVEGNAAYVTDAGLTTPYGVISEDDWIAPATQLVVRGQKITQLSFACEAMFTLYDPENTAQIYRKPNSSVNADIVYVGRGCPADALLANPNGKIAFADRNPVASRQPSVGAACSFDVKVKRLQDAGAIAVVIAQTTASTPQAFSLDGNPITQNLSIPAVMIDLPNANALRDALCPVQTGGGCAPAPGAFANLVDRRGDWGSVRVVNVSNPASMTQTGQYRSPRSTQFPPPDNGVYAPNEAEAEGNRVYVPWNSDGLRVLDLVNGVPQERGFFIPADTPDPTNTLPRKAFVKGADIVSCTRVVITDINSGLYVLNVPPPREGCPT